MKPTLYNFNYSQDIVHLQTKFSLFQRVSNIIFSITFEEGFEDNIMYQAIQLLIERNDCLRLKTIKEGKEIKQYFEKERSIEEIPSIKFRRDNETNFIQFQLFTRYCTPSNQIFIVPTRVQYHILDNL